MTGKIDINFLIDASETIAMDLKNPSYSHIFEKKTRPANYKILKTLAKGGYGEVFIVQKESKIYAMKRVLKHLVIKNPNTTFFMNEKEIMTTNDSEWLVKCHECIQDGTYLYYIMDFIPGGDLMGYLSKIDILHEDEIKFYASEIFMAVDSMHKLGWIHRDLKPDNILVDRNGHIKLGDFGSSIKMTNDQAESSITVGTPDYVSPDLLVSVGSSVRYGREIDFWTIGVIIYEMLYGTTPFYSDSLVSTYSKISSIDFVYPSPISDDLKDLINNLLCHKDKRFNMEQVQKHSFFAGIDWQNLKSYNPPHIPEIAEEADISNFVDTEFIPDDSKIQSGFKDFIGFTYDPIHCRYIRSNLQADTDAVELSELQCKICVVDDEYSNNNRTGKIEMMSHRNCKDEVGIMDNQHAALELQIKTKKEELDKLNAVLKTVSDDKERKETLVNQYNISLKQTIDQLVYKKEDFEQIKSEINTAKEELQNIRNDISEKMNTLGTLENKLSSLGNLSSRTESSSTNSVEVKSASKTCLNYLEVTEDLKDLKKMVERSKFADKIDSLKKIAYWFYKENNNLKKDLRINAESISDTKSFEDLKKQLRIKKTEIREYQQKIDQEITMRRKLEDEIKGLKISLKNSSKHLSNLVFSCINVSNNRETSIRIENNVLRIEGKEVVLNNIFISELKNNELHHLSDKKRSLCVKIYFLKEVVKSSSTGTRRSLNALEADLIKENKILKGLNDLINVLDGKTLEEAKLQRQGSSKKLMQLQQEIEKAKKSTITEYEVNDDEKVHEFNNHLFYEKTVAKGTLCDHCNEILYGVVNQAFCCRDCLLVVHKACYVLGDVSCELSRAMKEGTSMSVLCRTVEDKEKLLQLNKLY